MGLYDHQDYKEFVRDWISQRPNSGRGQFRKMSLHLRVSSTMISQVFSGDKHLNLELASDLCDYMGLGPDEEEYFFLLLEHARAGSVRLKKKLHTRIEAAQTKARKISERVAKHKELTSEERATYYSSWIYTGIRNLLAIDRPWTAEEIAARLQVEISQVHAVIRFLIDKELIRQHESAFKIVSKATHLGSDNPLVYQHHQNWRLRALQKMDWHSAANLFYSGPMSLAVSDSEKVRAMILDLIQEINKLVIDSPSECVRCLNFDWFEY